MHAFLAKLKRRLRRGESGQSVILLAIGFVALIGFVGITTDVSLAFVRYAQLSRAVDAAAIAAANQIRQDAEGNFANTETRARLAATQFIEFHGLNPEDVWVDTCLSTNYSDPELCKDQAKLVRVRAFVKEPTVFMRVLGITHFDLVASAVSQTAALDVVIILDVSESMLAQTTYADWALTQKIGEPGEDPTYRNFGVIYRPPTDEEILRNFGLTDTSTPTVAQAFFPFWTSWRSPANPGGTDPADGLINFAQVTVNDRLKYVNARNAADVANTDTNFVDAYRVLFDKQFFTNAIIPDADWPTGPGAPSRIAEHPREMCRVRFYPQSLRFSSKLYNGYLDSSGNPVGLTAAYDAVAVATTNNAFRWPTSTNGFSKGFLPNYMFYDCCNDPDGVDGFADLNCSPFKETRDAVFQFLERIDFQRGDRAAIVTFNRNAFLVNPYGYPGAVADEGQRRGGMLDSYESAYRTLRDLVGVNAEPNFYNFVIPTNSPGLSANWGQLATNRYSAGIDEEGDSIVVNYDSTAGYAGGAVNVNNTDIDDNLYPHIYNFPVNDHCFITMGSLSNQYTPFPFGLQNISLPNGVLPFPSGYSPDGYDTRWEAYTEGSNLLLPVPERGKPAGQRPSYEVLMSYERWASCAQGNVGAALREGNNALLNPRTVRRFGTIWIMVLLSDGAAGASDVVRRNGDRPRAADPFQRVADPANASLSVFGIPGEYGGYGLCPIGVIGRTGELMRGSNDRTNGLPAYPYCSDEDPVTRFTCDFRPLRTLLIYQDGNPQKTALRDNQYVVYSAGNPAGPPSASVEEEWNSDMGHLYDVDIAPLPGGAFGGCDPLYDVDDYAHDWADYITLESLTGTGSAQLPTIFTIGFGMEFNVKTDSAGNPLVNLNCGTPPQPAKVNDPCNQVMARDNFEALCARNVSNCLGEQLMRYIADVGDNNIMDNDYYQDIMQEWYEWDVAPGELLELDGNLSSPEVFGARDRCQNPNDGPDPGTNSYDITNNGMDGAEIHTMYGAEQPNVSCGNYYFAPNAAELQFVFDDIASRMFTRLSR